MDFDHRRVEPVFDVSTTERESLAAPNGDATPARSDGTRSFHLIDTTMMSQEQVTLKIVELARSCAF